MALADARPDDMRREPASRSIDAEDAAAPARSFLRMVSHELRTPLNAVIGFSEIIAHELHGPIGDPRYAAHAKLVRDSGLKLLALVNQVLELVRLEQGDMDLDLHTEPLDEIASEALARVQAPAAAGGVRLVQRLDADADRCVCDRRGLQTVLGALLCNAVSASPRGGVVTLSARRRLDRIFIEVRDEGPGLDPADVPRLMKPFEQGESALVRRTRGAGLGLPIARLLCKAMGGRLHLETAPGLGVRALVRLQGAPEPAAA